MDLWRLIYEEMFSIGFRKSTNCLLSGKGKDAFQILPITGRYWYADPMVFRHQNTDYLFYEAFDKIKDKGVIACTPISEDFQIQSPTIVLEREYHLSYPFVFERDGRIFMIPETSANHTIEMYEAVSFPHEWKPLKTIFHDMNAVDSNFIEHAGSYYLFTVLEDKIKNELTLLAYIEKETSDKTDDEFQLIPHPANPLVCTNLTSRSAGRFFFHETRMIRPFQDCSNHDYGRALGFSEILELSHDIYHEEAFLVIHPSDIRINTDKKIYGVHTYARSSLYEFIDLKMRVFYVPFKYCRYLRRLYHKWKKQRSGTSTR